MPAHCAKLGHANPTGHFEMPQEDEIDRSYAAADRAIMALCFTKFE